MQAARWEKAARQSQRTGRLFGAAYFFFLFLSVSLVHWDLGSMPVRALYGTALLGALWAVCPAQCAAAFRKQRNTLLIILAFAVLGAGVSVLADDKPATVLRQILEIHLQATVNLLVAAAVLEICGARTLVQAFLVVVGLSMAFALVQAAGIDAAFHARQVLGMVDTEYDRSRPAGLSMNPVLLGSQLCLAVALLYMYRRYSRPPEDLRAEWSILALVAAGVAVSVASGTRSPILGMIVFVAVYLTRRFGAWAVVAGLLALALQPLLSALLDHLQTSDVRVLQIEDKSATGRWPLIVYGWRLFLARPLGYGLGFDPAQHWGEHWTALSHMKNAVVIRHLALHNYPLNMLNKYGAGLLLLAPFMTLLVRRHRMALLGFVPYAFHVLFHNDGPLDTDYMIWFVIALTSMRLSVEGRIASRMRQPPAKMSEVP
jgi:hypothetical protein